MESKLLDHPPNKLRMAVFTILVAIFLFDLQGALIKHMASRYPVEQISFFRNLLGIFPSLLVLYFSVEWRASQTPWRLDRWKLALSRGLILVCAQMCLYYALSHMQLATATTLAFAGPLFITLLSVPMLGHSVGWWRGGAVVLGFVGVVLVMQPASDSFSVVAFLPIASAFFYAIASLSSRLFHSSVPTALISIYASIAAMIAALLLVLINGQWVPLDSLADGAWFLAMGTVGGFAVLLLISAYRMADPSSLSPFEYFGIPFSFALGWLFFNESPFSSLFPGVLLIVGAGLLVIWREKKNKARLLNEQ